MNGKVDKTIDWIYINIFNRFRSIPERPDFNKAILELAEFTENSPYGGRTRSHHAVFTDTPPEIAVRNHWMTGYMDYIQLADYLFARKYPDHKFSIAFRKNYAKLSDDYIYIWAKVGMHNGQKVKLLLRELIADHPEEYPEYFKIRQNPQKYDPLYDKAVEIIKKYKRVSTKLLIKKLKIDYAHAARLLDTMESTGIIGPADRSKPRNVLLDE